MDYILRLLIDLVIRASCYCVIGQCFDRSNDVDYLGAGMRFDAVLTFLALRWSLDMSGQETFLMLLSLKRSRCIRTELLLESYNHGQFV
jgi:hypothetical protein